MASSDKISGADGAATYAGTIVITGWSITMTNSIKDVTDSSSTTWVETLSNGFKGWNGTLTGWYLDGTTVTPVTTGASAELVLTAETGVTWTGNANITEATVDLTVHEGDAARVTYSFVGDGALAEVNA